MHVLTFKCLERLLLCRIKPLKPTLENTIVVEQAGFRQGRSAGDQVRALTTFIENGFQLKQKTGVVFLDLTAAFDLAPGSTTEALQNSSTLDCRHSRPISQRQTLPRAHC